MKQTVSMGALLPGQTITVGGHTPGNEWSASLVLTANVASIPGPSHSVSYSLQHLANPHNGETTPGPQTGSANFLVGGNALLNGIVFPHPGMGHVDVYTISIRAVSGSVTDDYDIVVTGSHPPVPSPGTWSLGLVGLGLVSMRRNRS